MDELRWRNVERARRAYEDDEALLAARPLEAFFEVAARCNLRCQMCAINYDTRYSPRGGRPPFFEPDLFERLAPIFPTLLRGYLFGLGEPLLNKHLPDYAKRLSDAGVEVWFNSNATLIDEKRAFALAEAGVSAITVSIDGATAETYERIRVGASFDAVVRGIRALVAARERYGRPRVDLSFVAMASNIVELPRLVELCSDLGATGIHVEPLYSQQQSDLEIHYQRENLGVAGELVVRHAFDEARRIAARQNVRIASRFDEDAHGSGFDYVERSKSLRPDWKCSEPWASVWITSAGEVRTCCMNDTSFGSLFESSFDEIWNGESFLAFRRAHARREVARGCANCIRNGRMRNSPFFTAIEPVTYRPIERRPGGTGIEIRTPSPGETLTDPLHVSGVISDGGQWEIMVGHTPIGPARPDPNGHFVLDGGVPFLTEGAHLLWARRSEGGGDAGHREFHFWRPQAAPGVTPMTATGVLRHFAPRHIWSISAEIDGHRWRGVEFFCDDRPSTRVALLDLRRLPPGTHEVRLRVNGVLAAPVAIERLAV